MTTSFTYQDQVKAAHNKEIVKEYDLLIQQDSNQIDYYLGQLGWLGMNNVDIFNCTDSTILKNALDSAVQFRDAIKALVENVNSNVKNKIPAEYGTQPDDIAVLMAMLGASGK